jgi:hypothetical protein
MMRQSGARALLDRSHQAGVSPSPARNGKVSAFPSADTLHDYLPMMDWIRQREAERARGS